MDCALCRSHVAQEDRARYFELAVCRACKSANIAVPIKEADRELTVELVNAGSDNQKRPPTIRARGRIGSISNVKVDLSRRTGLITATEWIFGKLRTGDKLFDDHVWARSDDKRSALALLSVESVQACLLECTADGSVHIRGGVVTCTRIAPGLGYHDVNETARGLLVLMHYLHAGHPSNR